MHAQGPPPTPTQPLELTLLLTSFIAVTYAFGVYMFSTLLPDMRAALGLNYTEIGWITGLGQVGFLLGAFVCAPLVRWLGAVRLILASVAACGACLALMPLVANAVQIAALMVITGAAAATVWVPMVAVVQGGIAAQHQGKVLGLLSSGTAYGLFLNGFSTPALLPLGGWKLVWVFSAVLTFALLAWGLARLRVGPAAATLTPDAQTPHPAGDAGWRALRRDPMVQVVLLMMFFNGIACMPTMNYLVSFLREELGYSSESAGWVWSTIGFVGMFGGLAMGALADKITVARALSLSYLLLATCTLLFLHHVSLAEVLLGGALFGLVFNSIFGLIPAFVSLTFDARKATAVFALCNVLLGLGSMLGNLLGGLMREQQQSFVPVYLGSLAVDVMLIGLSLYLVGARRRRAALA